MFVSCFIVVAIVVSFSVYKLVGLTLCGPGKKKNGKYMNE